MIVLVAVTREFPQCVVLSRVVSQRFMTHHLTVFGRVIWVMRRFLHVAFWASGYDNPGVRYRLEILRSRWTSLQIFHDDHAVGLPLLEHSSLVSAPTYPLLEAPTFDITVHLRDGCLHAEEKYTKYPLSQFITPKSLLLR